MTPTVVVITIIAACAAPLGAYLIAARRFSGRIESSDAKDLWAESRSIRDWSQGRIASLEARVAHLEEENRALRAQIATGRVQ